MFPSMLFVVPCLNSIKHSKETNMFSIFLLITWHVKTDFGVQWFSAFFWDRHCFGRLGVSKESKLPSLEQKRLRLVQQLYQRWGMDLKKNVIISV